MTNIITLKVFQTINKRNENENENQPANQSGEDAPARVVPTRDPAGRE